MTLVAQVLIRDFRSAERVSFDLGGLCALVGEADAGKSNILAAIRAALAPEHVRPHDVRNDGSSELLVRLDMAGGGTIELGGSPPGLSLRRTAEPPPVRFFAAGKRSRELADIFESWLAAGVSGRLVLIEEPELYLRPQAQRYLYRLLRRLVETGNQVVYSTHSPFLLDVTRLDELLFVRRRGRSTQAMHPAPVEGLSELRAHSEFSSDRTELFLARAAVLVEGLTERLVLPYVFASLGIDRDREGISIIECGGKSSMPLIARVARAAGVPFVAIHDRDAPRGRRPSPTHRALNAAIADATSPGRLVVLEPDFEAVAGLRGHEHKPEHAWRRFARLDPSQMPPPLVRAALVATRLATGAPDELIQASGASR